MNPDLPFTAEYAKSGRAACKACKENIAKDSLRMGIMIQSSHFDGKIPLWHHLKCFLGKKGVVVPSVNDIANFDNLRWEDQEKIKEKIGTMGQGTSKTRGGKTKSEFSIEYAKSSRAVCRTCDQKIEKKVIRISKLDLDSDAAKRFGPCPGWRHVDCFIKDRLQLDFTESADKLPGFDLLDEEDKKLMLEKIGKISIKRSVDQANGTSSKKLCKDEHLMKSQNALLFDMRDKLQEMSKKELIELLEYNNQHVSPGDHRNRDNLSDCLVFGAIKTCPECKSAAPRYKIDCYRCSGNLTEWTKCTYFTKCPEREPFKIPEEYKEKYEFLKDYRYVKRDRILPEKEESASASTRNGPLTGYIMAVFGKFSTTKKAVTEKVQELGGTISTKVDRNVQFCISSQSEVDKNSKNVKSAQKFDIHIVSEKFLDDVKKGSTPAISIKENLICVWGRDPILKFGIKQENKKSQDVASTSSSSKSKSLSVSKSGTMKIAVKGGVAVDPDSKMENVCHVYQEKDNVYSCVLGMVDISRGCNSYYKLQILKDDKRAKYWLFRSWGRVGTTIGGTKIENMSSLSFAVSEFERLYLDKTGNNWSDRKNFVKKPGCMYPLDIDYGQESDKPHQELKPSDTCKLPKEVQELICLIFDIEAMKKTMLEFEIDLQKMPLGKLSKKQIDQAYSVLNEAQQIIVTGCNQTKILDASNRFYTLIPHEFGLRAPPLLDNDELIKSKIEMLDSLLEIEIAYSLMKSQSEDTQDMVTEHYGKLKTDIEVLDKKSEEYDTIQKYLKNTHGGTHNMFTLGLKKVFKINRHGESDRYSKYKNLHNRQLLWHGSRLTNYVGILSQGLRIAPPEAPVTGYMFGKGVYFADMVSKSAQYCATSRSSPRGLMLLCEVALGDMNQLTHATQMDKPPKGYHSTKGLGMTIPDPKDATFIGDVKVPYGKPIPSNVSNAYLMYNEYIVYDVKQINIKYLLEVDCKWKY